MTKRILVVDDDANTTRLLKGLLEKDGEYLVRGKNDALKALDTTREFQPDLILLDVLLPELDGPRIAALIRAESAFAHVPIIFVTGIVEQGEMFKQDKLGMFALLAKPARIEEVREAIRAQLAVKPAAS